MKAIVAGLVMLVAACSGGSTGTTVPETTVTTSTTSSTTTTTTTTIPDPVLPPQLEAWATTVISIGGVDLLVAVAHTEELRRQGLMEVEDLGDLDGMMFVFDTETTGGFWMKNTVLPLDIAFFDGVGRFVDRLTMEPCRADPCLVYFASGPYRFAVEVPAGRFVSLTGDERLALSE